MSGEEISQAAEEGHKGDEVEYLKIILDSIAQRGSVEDEAVDINGEFLQDLKRSVDSTLRVDSRIREDVRTKVLNAFDVLIYNYAKHMGVLP